MILLDLTYLEPTAIDGFLTAFQTSKSLLTLLKWNCSDSFSQQLLSIHLQQKIEETQVQVLALWPLPTVTLGLICKGQGLCYLTFKI